MQDKNFSQMVKKTHQFNTNRNILEEMPPMPEKRIKPMTAPLIEHDKSFKPSNPGRIGYNKTLAPFPYHMGDPPRELTRKRPVEGEDDERKAFKPQNRRNKSVPSPSVMTNMRNIKLAFPSIFRR